MERSKYYVMCLLCWFLFLEIGSVSAQDKSDMLLKAYLNGDMNSWLMYIEDAQSKNGQSVQQRLELLDYEYGYIAYLLSVNKKKEASAMLKKAILLLQSFPNWEDDAKLLSLMSAFNGFRIALSPLKAPFLGPQAQAFAEKAIRVAGDVPWGYIQMGNIKNYAPSIFGGNKQEALMYYQSAQKLFKVKMPDTYIDNWQYLNLVIIMADVFFQNKNRVEAQRLYKYLIELHPDFKWVRDDLQFRTK